MQETVETRETAVEALSLKERNTALMEAVEAVDALNSWVKSESFRIFAGADCSRAVYYLKRCAIKALHEAAKIPDQKGSYDQISVGTNFVGVPVSCRVCGGTGIYHDAYYSGFNEGETYDRDGQPCRTCQSKGMVCLYFITTAVYYKWSHFLTWHTPAHEYFQWPGSDFPRPNNVVPGATGWSPNTPGHDLTPSQAAAQLNHAETFFTERPISRSRSERPIEGEPSYGSYGGRCGGGGRTGDDFAYSLFIGQTTAGMCATCGAVPPAGMDAIKASCFFRKCHKSEGPLSWLSLVCPACWNQPDFWETIPFPEALLGDENVRAWAQRHGFNEEARHA